MRRFLLLSLLLTALGLAQEAKPLKVVSVEAWAEGYVKRPIQVTVKVQNPNSEATSGMIRLLLAPQTTSYRKEGQPSGVLDPSELTEMVEDLAPGATTEVIFHTDYLAPGNFKNRIGHFTAMHPIAAMGTDLRVTYRVVSEL